MKEVQGEQVQDGEEFGDKGSGGDTGPLHVEEDTPIVIDWSDDLEDGITTGYVNK